MYNHILVPLDISERSEKILPYVEHLALCHLSKVVFLHVLEAPRAVNTSGGMKLANENNFEPQKREAQTYFQEIQNNFKEKGIESKVHMAHGPIVEEIINVSEKENVDLIAMASHGRSGISRVFYGSVAAGVLQRIDRPLLLIRSRQQVTS